MCCHCDSSNNSSVIFFIRSSVVLGSCSKKVIFLLNHLQFCQFLRGKRNNVSFRFDCLIYLLVKHDWDVAAMQDKMQELLQRPHNHPDGRQLYPDETSIRTVAVGKLPAGVSFKSRRKT